MGTDQVASETTESQPVSSSAVAADRENGGGGEDDSGRNKQPVRKRTKTGCLSESSLPLPPSLSRTLPPARGLLQRPTLTCSPLTTQSLPQAPHQVRRGQARLQQLHQVQAQLRGLQPARHLQRSHRRISWRLRARHLPARALAANLCALRTPAAAAAV